MKVENDDGGRVAVRKCRAQMKAKRAEMKREM